MHKPLFIPAPWLYAAVILAAGSLIACPATTRQAARPIAPKWFNNPPAPGRLLFFVGSTSNASDEQTARELAIQKALSELTVFCGANIKSDFVSEEVEKNGQLTQSVSLTVDIAGDELTIREAVVKETKIAVGPDGSWDAYALLQWPKAQYEAVLKNQRDRAERALALFNEADAAASAMQLAQAKSKLAEAKQILGPMKAQVPLRHSKFTNSALLWEAVAALKIRLTNLEKERRSVFHVAVVCEAQGKSGCPSHRTGAVKQKVSSLGYRVSTERIDPAMALEVLGSNTPKADASLRSAGFLLAVQYQAKLTAKEDGFVFVHCGARGVVYDTDANRIADLHEVKPMKGGHVHFDGALEKGCAKAETALLQWMEQSLPSHK